MSSIHGVNIHMEVSEISDLLKENWAWVDQRLEELYHGYGLTEENSDDYIEAGLLSESFAWVDEELQRQVNAEFEDRVPCPAPISWVLYKNYDSQHCLEDEGVLARRRAESDISDHSDEVDRVLKRLDIQSPLPKGMYPIDYSYLYSVADEVTSVEQDFDECSSITNCSESSSVIFEFEDNCDVGYDSF